MLFMHLKWLWLLCFFAKMLQKQFKFLYFPSMFHCDREEGLNQFLNKIRQFRPQCYHSSPADSDQQRLGLIETNNSCLQLGLLYALSLRNFGDALYSQKKTHTHWTQSKNLFLELNTKVCEHLNISSFFKLIKHLQWLLILSAVNQVVKFPSSVFIIN